MEVKGSRSLPLDPKRRPGSEDLFNENPGKFPFEAWTVNADSNEQREITLRSTWDLVVAGDLNVQGSLDVDTNLNVDGTAQIDGNTNIDGTLDVTGVTILSSLEVTGETDLNFSHVRAAESGGQTVQNDAEKLEYDTITDALNDWDETNNRFVAPAEGWYLVTAYLQTDSYAQTTGDRMILDIYKNGTQDIRLDHHEVENGITAVWTLGGATSIYLEEDDYIELWWQGVGLGSMTTVGNVLRNYFTIDRLPT